MWPTLEATTLYAPGAILCAGTSRANSLIFTVTCWAAVAAGNAVVEDVPEDLVDPLAHPLASTATAPAVTG